MVRKRLRAVLLSLALLASPATAQDGTSLPNGATSLQEAYEDWVVSCGLSEAGKHCTLSQQQTQQNGQRVLAIELAVEGDTVSGSLVLPFGLALAAGAGVQVDEQEQTTVPFGTCLPAGCLVRLSLSEEQVAAMRRGSQLKVRVRPDGSSETAVLTISLKGFSVALDRTRALAR